LSWLPVAISESFGAIATVFTSLSCATTAAVTRRAEGGAEEEEEEEEGSWGARGRGRRGVSWLGSELSYE
jgi:hypothetical protein